MRPPPPSPRCGEPVSRRATVSLGPNHVILNNTMHPYRYSRCTFWWKRRRTPNLRISWFIGIGILSALVSACGTASTDSPTAPGGPPAPGSTIVYTAVGASDATGHGGSVECVPFVDCPNGTGYVPVTARSLRGQGYSVTLTNLGIPTAVIGPDFQALGRQYGRTIVGNF